MNETLDVVKDILANMPKDATGVRINRGWGIFYRYDEFEKNGQFQVPHRRLRYSNLWVPVNINSWKTFVEENQVMNAFNFRFMAHRQFFIELKGMDLAEKVVQCVPENATHYNYLSNMYYRSGNKYAEFWTSEDHQGWLESTMLNDEAEQLLISIEELEIKIKDFLLV